MLIPIAVIGFGHHYKTEHEKHIEALGRTVGKERVVRMDLRDFCHDPHNMLKANGVQGDGTHGQTQIAVISQPEFVEAIHQSFHLVIDRLWECGERHQADPSSCFIGVVVAAAVSYTHLRAHETS